MANSQDGNKNVLCVVWLFERPAVTSFTLIFASSIGEKHLIQLCRVEQENEINWGARAVSVGGPHKTLEHGNLVADVVIEAEEIDVLAFVVLVAVAGTVRVVAVVSYRLNDIDHFTDGLVGVVREGDAADTEVLTHEESLDLAVYLRTDRNVVRLGVMVILGKMDFVYRLLHFTSRLGTMSVFVPRFASMILIESVLKNQAQFPFCPIRIEMVFGPI